MDKRKATRYFSLGVVAIGLVATAWFIYAWKEQYAMREKYAIQKVQKESTVGTRPQGNCAILGRVISAATGKPIEHARVSLLSLATHGSIDINTASNGTFAFRNISQGPFSLKVFQTQGYQDVSYDPENKGGQTPTFSLSDGEQRPWIELKALPACRISGKIVDENGKKPNDIADWTVVAWTEDDEGKQYRQHVGRVDKANGVYAIDGLGKPAYVMAVNWNAWKGDRTCPPVYAPGVFSRGDAKLITFDAKTNAENVDITLKRDGGLILKGTVRDQAGNPVPEAFVVVHRRDLLFDFVTAYTDEQGNYQIEGLGDGEFQVHVDAVHQGLVRVRRPVDLGKTSSITRQDFTLPQGVLISGKFVDEEGHDWQIGESYGYANVTGRANPGPTFVQIGFRNKYRPEIAKRGFGGTFCLGEGEYGNGEMIFPTPNTFVFQGMLPGSTKIGFLPKKEKQKVVKILYNGQDVKDSGIETKPGEDVKDVTIVIGKQ